MSCRSIGSWLEHPKSKTFRGLRVRQDHQRYRLNIFYNLLKWYSAQDGQVGVVSSAVGTQACTHVYTISGATVLAWFCIAYSGCEQIFSLLEIGCLTHMLSNISHLRKGQLVSCRFYITFQSQRWIETKQWLCKKNQLLCSVTITGHKQLIYLKDPNQLYAYHEIVPHKDSVHRYVL